MFNGLFGRNGAQQLGGGIDITNSGMGMQRNGGMGMHPMMGGSGLFDMSRPAMMPRKPNHMQQLFENPQFALGMGMLNASQGGNPMDSIVQALLSQKLRGGGLFD